MTAAIVERRLGFMGKKVPWFRLVSLAGLVLGGLGTLMSTWAEERERDAVIEEKVNEALAKREENEEEEES